MPPAPMRSTTSYGPSRVLASSGMRALYGRARRIAEARCVGETPTRPAGGTPAFPGTRASSPAGSAASRRRRSVSSSLEPESLLLARRANALDDCRIERAPLRLLRELLLHVLRARRFERLHLRLQLGAFLRGLRDVLLPLRGRHFLHFDGQIFRHAFVEVDPPFRLRIDESPRGVRVHGFRFRELTLDVHGGRGGAGRVRVLRFLARRTGVTVRTVCDVRFVELCAE